MMTIENAVARSISHNEIVPCEFDGDWKSLKAHVSETFANGNDAVFSEENDGTIDIADIDGEWRVRVTLTEEKEISLSDLVIDKNQGLDEQNRKFGYVHTGDEDNGGFFFTWMPTLEETLASLDPDQQDEPTFSESMAREFLESKIASRFAGEE